MLRLFWRQRRRLVLCLACWTVTAALMLCHRCETVFSLDGISFIAWTWMLVSIGWAGTLILFPGCRFYNEVVAVGILLVNLLRFFLPRDSQFAVFDQEYHGLIALLVVFTLVLIYGTPKGMKFLPKINYSFHGRARTRKSPHQFWSGYIIHPDHVNTHMQQYFETIAVDETELDTYIATGKQYGPMAQQVTRIHFSVFEPNESAEWQSVSKIGAARPVHQSGSVHLIQSMDGVTHVQSMDQICDLPVGRALIAWLDDYSGDCLDWTINLLENRRDWSIGGRRLRRLTARLQGTA
jgi:hypothetical protein